MTCPGQEIVTSPCALLQARRLLQEGSVWDEYTQSEGRFYVGSQLIKMVSNTPEDAEACAKLCQNAGDTCWFWSFCPPDAGAGWVGPTLRALDNRPGCQARCSCADRKPSCGASVQVRVGAFW